MPEFLFIVYLGEVRHKEKLLQMLLRRGSVRGRLRGQPSGYIDIMFDLATEMRLQLCL